MHPNEELTHILRRMRRDYLKLLDLVPQADWHGSGHRSLPGFLAGLLSIAPRKARQLVAHAELVAQTSLLTGRPTKPKLRATRSAMQAGTLGADQLTAIGKTLAAIPDGWASPRDRVERMLATAAANAGPHALAALGRRELVDLELVEDPSPPSHPSNRLRYRIRNNGSIVGQFQMSPTTARLMLAALDRLATTPADRLDVRAPAERLGDALATMVHTAITDLGPTHDTALPARHAMRERGRNGQHRNAQVGRVSTQGRVEAPAARTSDAEYRRARHEDATRARSA